MEEIDQLIEKLKENSKVIQYLAGYEPGSAERFLRHYAGIKQLILKYGDTYKRGCEQRLGYYKSRAEKYYWFIAQKKLFNLQCLWRAEKIELPVAISYEFVYWEHNIEACPFVEPVTDEELQIFINFLDTTRDNSLDTDVYDWQDYDDFKESETGSAEDTNYPDWYTFYDTYFGTHPLLVLPNIRGEREERYLNAWRKSEFPQSPNAPVMETRPHIHYEDDQLEDFIRAVEPHKIFDYYKFYKADTDTYEEEERLEPVIKQLLKEPGEVIIPEGKFPDVIHLAAHQLKIAKIKELLLIVHEEQEERRAMGISTLPKKNNG